MTPWGAIYHTQHCTLHISLHAAGGVNQLLIMLLLLLCTAGQLLVAHLLFKQLHIQTDQSDPDHFSLTAT
jgi:hypothetical protein